MSEQYPGGFITKSPVAPTAIDASGIWTISQYAQYVKAQSWPGLGFIDPYYDNVSLLLHMDGANGGTTFTDSGPDGFYVAPTSCTTSTTQVKFGTASGAFNGTNSLLVCPDPSAFTFGTGDYTVEFWVYINSHVINGDCVILIGTTAAYMNLMLRLNNNWTVTVGTGSAWALVDQQFAVAQTGQWAHIAVVRASGQLTVYYNGVAGYTVANTTNMTQTGGLWVGGPYGGYYFNGYIDDLRITKGIARYTGNFSVPTAAYFNTGSATVVDPFYSNDSLLLHFDGASGSTTFTDSSPSPKTVTASGGSLSTTQIKYGTAALTGVVAITDSSDFNMGSGDFTMEFWFYPTSNGSSTSVFLGNPNGSGGYSDFIIGWSSGAFYLYATSAASTYIAAGLIGVITPTLNAWHHIAWSRVGSSWQFYIDGVADSGLAITSSAALYHNNLGYVFGVSSYYTDDLRVTKGVGRYSANFTPPQLPFPNTATGSTYATWNPSDKSTKITLAYNNTQAVQTTTGNNTAVRANKAISTGKWYWECSNQNSTYVGVGVATASATVDGFGQTGQSFYYDSNGNKYVNGSASGYGTSWRNGTSTVGVALDADAGTLGFYLNNVFQGQFAYALTNPVYPLATFPNDLGDTITANFGQNPLKYTPPNGTFWNPRDGGGSPTYSNKNLTVALNNAYYTIRSNTSKSSGKWYFELIAGGANVIVGVANSSAPTSDYPGADANAWCYYGLSTGYSTHSGTHSIATGTTSAGDVIGVAWDAGNGYLDVYKNGTLLTGTHLFTGVTGTLYACIGAANDGAIAASTANFGASNFAYSIPSGYAAWDTTTYAAGVY